MNRVFKGEHYGEAYGFECPGCGMMHLLPVTGERGWKFNGNLEWPTFEPSILSKAGRGKDLPPLICHSYVTDGKIQFLGDCSHELAGKTVELPEAKE
jgi:hypothetical protein